MKYDDELPAHMGKGMTDRQIHEINQSAIVCPHCNVPIEFHDLHENGQGIYKCPRCNYFRLFGSLYIRPAAGETQTHAQIE